MSVTRSRRRVPLPPDAITVRPRGGWPTYALKAYPRSGKARVASLILSVLAISVGVYLTATSENLFNYGLAAILLVPLLAGSTLLWMWQPGTLLYAADGHIGHRTVLGTMYDVPSTGIEQLRVDETPIEGALIPTIVFADHDGRCVLRHYNANYDADALSQFADRVGIRFA
jgi:hypothetical protein